MEADGFSSGHVGWLWTTNIVTLGGLVLAALLAPPASTPAPRALTWLLFLCSSVHVAATAFLFSFGEVRGLAVASPARYVVAPIALVVAAVVLAEQVSRASLAWLLLPYFAWQQWHFQKQNLGFAALAASCLGVPGLDRSERRALLLSGAAGALGLVTHPALVQLQVRPSSGPVFVIAGLLLTVAVVVGLVALARRRPDARPLGFVAPYVMGLLFSAPVFVFDSPYAAVGGMTIAHGLQYLLLVGMVSAGQDRGSSRVIAVAGLANVALIGGALLNRASHLHGSGAMLRAGYGVYLGLVMAHFVVDAGLWRLRDPAVRAFIGGRRPDLVPTRT